jgi:hypothetical protein
MKGGPIDGPNRMSFVEKRQVLMKEKEKILAQLKQGVAEGSEQEKPIKKSDWFDPTDMRSPEKQKAAYLNHLAAKKKNKNIKEQGVAEGAKVDRMVRHVKSSEKRVGHSDEEAKNIAWATANKRGMLNNRNKK